MATPDKYDTVPAALREFDQFVVWRYRKRDGKPKKVPFNPREPDREADVTDPQSWGTFEEAVTAARSDRRSKRGPIAGIGFVFTAGDLFCGYDFDDCIADGKLHPAAAEIIDQLHGHKELSPSGTGMHVICIANAKHDARHRTDDTPWGGKFECYDRARFFTITGGGEGEPQPQQEQHDKLIARLLPHRPKRTQPTQVGGGANGRHVDVDDQELLQRAFAARNGAKIRALYHGDISGHGDNDSDADLALCGHLARSCGCRRSGFAPISGLFRGWGPVWLVAT